MKPAKPLRGPRGVARADEAEREDHMKKYRVYTTWRKYRAFDDHDDACAFANAYYRATGVVLAIVLAQTVRDRERSAAA